MAAAVQLEMLMVSGIILIKGGTCTGGTCTGVGRAIMHALRCLAAPLARPFPQQSRCMHFSWGKGLPKRQGSETVKPPKP